jgi:hypothetical protein
MKKHTLILILFSLSFSVLVAQKLVNKSFTGVKKIKMNTASGSCVITKSSDASVKVSVQYTYDDNRFEPRMEQEGDRLVIKEVFNNNSNNGNSSWTLAIPDNIPFDYSTGSGDFGASNISLDLDANTGSGDLTFTNVTGKVDGSTGSGDIELINVNGDIKANTGSGNMRVEKCKGDISLNCGSGNLKLIDNQATMSANTGSGNISAMNMILEGSSSFNTGSGDAEVALGATPKFNVSVNSGSGDAELNFNGNEIKGEIVMKASKRNGKIVAPFEFDKTEEIDNNNRGDDNVTIKKTVVKGNGTNKISVATGSGSATLRK